MSKYICDRCKGNYDTEEYKKTPVCTILGTAAGVLAGLMTGYTVVLAPIGLFAGLAADAARCEECGTDKNLYKVMVEKVDKSGERVYQSVPRTLYDATKLHRYDTVEGHFIETEADPESIELNVLTPDFPEYEVSFEAPDLTLEPGYFDFDLGDFGDGGDFGGTDSGDGSAGGGDMGSGFGGGEAGGGE